MKVEELVIMFVSLIICIGLITLVIKVKKKFIKDINKSLCIAISVRVLALVILNYLALKILGEALPVIFNTLGDNYLVEVVKLFSINVGLAFLWYFVLVFLSKTFYDLIFGNSNEGIEIERDNYLYFILRGVLTLTVIVLSTILFESVLRSFVLKATTSFYH